eukprot:scaffold215_cov389-Pavlova_lutheri.AAC.9
MFPRSMCSTRPMKIESVRPSQRFKIGAKSEGKEICCKIEAFGKPPKKLAVRSAPDVAVVFFRVEIEMRLFFPKIVPEEGASSSAGIVRY